MIAFLQGILEQVGLQTVVLNVGGVGYEVLAHDRLRDTLRPQKNQDVKILTHLIHREDQMTLIGFLNSHEKEVFLHLIKVSGVGARTALGMISALSAETIVKAIATNQPKDLKKAPGIGLKTAQRIILELREKLTHLPTESPLTDIEGVLSAQDQEEMELALLTLGYEKSDIHEALLTHAKEIQNAQGLEDILRIMIEKLSH